jgi:RNA polymerase sigma-70 factor (ECF subfamily)
MKGHSEMANDLCQEVFIKIWKALPNFKNLSSPKTWIYKITVNTCLLHIRNTKKNLSVDIKPDLPFEEPASSDYSDLYDAIGELKELDRIIIMLVLDEVEYPEIAQIVGIQESNLRVKIHRIKKKLNEILSQKWKINLKN